MKVSVRRIWTMTSATSNAVVSQCVYKNIGDKIGSGRTILTDQLNLTLITDDVMAAQFQELAPHKNVFDLNTPLKVSGNVEIPAPTLSTVVNWMHQN
jgi:hypothetical protein